MPRNGTPWPPWLEAMSPSRRGQALAGATSSGPPVRMAFLFIPNGVHAPEWKPQGTGLDCTLPPMLAPLERHRENMSILTGLGHHNAMALGDGPGDHARSSACFLTGAHPYKTDGADIRAGVSVDQVAASHIGSSTRFSSLELGCEPGLQSGSTRLMCLFSQYLVANLSPMEKQIIRGCCSNVSFRFPPANPPPSRADVAERSILGHDSQDARRLHRDLGLRDVQVGVCRRVRSIERLELVESVSRDPEEVAGMATPRAFPRTIANICVSCMN